MNVYAILYRTYRDEVKTLYIESMDEAGASLLFHASNDGRIITISKLVNEVDYKVITS